MKNHLLVSEIFGPTLQGEGPSTGKRACFLRLGGCNLHCSFCDTAYTWRFSDYHPHRSDQVFDKSKELTQMSFQAIFEKLAGMDTELLVITGGEPLLQGNELYDFLSIFERRYLDHFVDRVEIETAGTIAPGRLARYGWVNFNVSPKLRSSGNLYHERINQEALEAFAVGRTIFKFVVCSEGDFSEIDSIAQLIKLKPSQIWIMPEGETEQKQIEAMKWVAPLAIELGYNFSARLHTLIWGNKRGI